MREQLAGLARAALAVVLEAGGRATSVMIHNIGRLLEELGTRPEAEPLAASISRRAATSSARLASGR